MRSSGGSTADGDGGGGGATPQDSPRQGPLPWPRRSPSPSTDEGGNTKLFVGNISRDIQDYHVEGLFSQYGRVRNVFMKGKVCFVEFYDPKDADDARCELNGQEFGWSHICVEFATEVQSVPKVPSLGCYNCGSDEKDYGSKNCWNSHKELGRRINRSYRSSHSRSTSVQDVDVKRNFGYVEFSDPWDAYEARYDLDGRKFDESHINVEFARGVPRGPGGVCQYGRGPPPGRCYNCGMDEHCVCDCKAADWRDKCFRFGEMGHIERSCENSPKDLKRGRSYSRSPSPHHGKSRRRSYSRSPSPCRGKGLSRTYRQERSYLMSPSPRHGKGRGRSYSRSPSPRHRRIPSQTYSRWSPSRRDYHNAGGEDLPSRRPHYSPNPRRNLPPREQAERNGSYHGGSSRRGEARGKRQ